MCCNDNLKFSKGNAKLDKSIYSFSLLSGWACPFAEKCKSRAVEMPNGKRTVKDDPTTKFRCFSATQEVMWKETYKARKYNFDMIRHCANVHEMVHLINQSIPKKAKKIRIHIGGDFFNQVYFDAWCLVALANPDKTFYAYTKSLPYWISRLPPETKEWIKQNPNRRVCGVAGVSNLILTASRGGRYDNLIDEYGLRSVNVFFSENETEGLDIDHDDSHAMTTGPDFGLILHGVQPAGTEAATAMQKLRKQGKHGYNRKKKASQ